MKTRTLLVVFLPALVGCHTQAIKCLHAEVWENDAGANAEFKGMIRKGNMGLFAVIECEMDLHSDYQLHFELLGDNSTYMGLAIARPGRRNGEWQALWILRIEEWQGRDSRLVARLVKKRKVPLFTTSVLSNEVVVWDSNEDRDDRR